MRPHTSVLTGFAHAAVMSFQAFRNLISRGELLGVAALVIIGVALIVLAPAKQSQLGVADLLVVWVATRMPYRAGSVHGKGGFINI